MVDPSKASTIDRVPPDTAGETDAVIVKDSVVRAGFRLDSSVVVVGTPTRTAAGSLALASHAENPANDATMLCEPGDRESSNGASPFASSGAGRPPSPSTCNDTAGMNPFSGCGAGRTCA